MKKMGTTRVDNFSIKKIKKIKNYRHSIPRRGICYILVTF